MNPTTMIRKLHFLYSLAATSLLFFSQSNAGTIIVSEAFGGLAADPLNGTTADTFDAAITTAGGSSTWVGSTDFAADGSTPVSTSTLSGIWLDLGDYINDHKGEADGIFELTATMTHASGSSTNNLAALAIGFRVDSTPNPAQHFLFGGVASWWQRGNGTLSEMIIGPGNGNRVATADVPAGDTPVTVTITLDLSTHNGVDDFGSVSYESSQFPINPVNNGDPDLPFDLTADVDFRYLLVSESRQTGGTFDNLSLVQVPEPGSLALLGISGFCCLLTAASAQVHIGKSA